MSVDYDPSYEDELMDCPGPKGVHRSLVELAQLGIVIEGGTRFHCHTTKDFAKYQKALEAQKKSVEEGK